MDVKDPIVLELVLVLLHSARGQACTHFLGGFLCAISQEVLVWRDEPRRCPVTQEHDKVVGHNPHVHQVYAQHS